MKQDDDDQDEKESQHGRIDEGKTLVWIWKTASVWWVGIVGRNRCFPFKHHDSTNVVCAVTGVQ